MATINHLVFDTGKFKVEAQIEATLVAASGDGRHEPREPAHAECVLDALFLTRVRWHRGVKLYECREVECPDWLRDVILQDAQEAADEEVVAEEADAAADWADARFEELRA